MGPHGKPARKQMSDVYEKSRGRPSLCSFDDYIWCINSLLGWSAMFCLGGGSSDGGSSRVGLWTAKRMLPGPGSDQMDLRCRCQLGLVFSPSS